MVAMKIALIASIIVGCGVLIQHSLDANNADRKSQHHQQCRLMRSLILGEYEGLIHSRRYPTGEDRHRWETMMEGCKG